ncbi:hypothetical protein [Jeotgalicoccus halotolerans]|uniref:Uncharacterized protein n=1 Tax=Jeotgalicoccus halotolerans TaxID=157227 RepID=A0A3E0AZX7_9STAP|nr:hypothetical protein [Jeotgalicoccus halotolerans]REG25277.1 hypothetical protein DFR63_0303 [Jeotgalicoccus halotolerans]
MTTKLNLYDHRIEPIGTATFIKAKNGYEVVYNDDVHYGNTTLTKEELPAYLSSMGLNSMSGKQTSLMDFI